jgi:RNA polymerase-binding transcription factor DksA
MTADQLARYRDLLRHYANRLREDASSVAQQALAQTGGQADGGLSNAPLHLADLGTETYLQELSATLLENEKYLVKEAEAALRRIEKGTFGLCEVCDRPIPKARLDAIPFTRHCTSCAGSAAPGPQVNINFGRPGLSRDESEFEGKQPADREPSDSADSTTPSKPRADRHAAGTPGGGTAVGGLAGTTIGRGDPEGVNLEAAGGSGDFDVRAARKSGVAYAGHAGGEVGGVPAGKRAGTRKSARAK